MKILLSEFEIYNDINYFDVLLISASNIKQMNVLFKVSVLVDFGHEMF